MAQDDKSLENKTHSVIDIALGAAKGVVNQVDKIGEDKKETASMLDAAREFAFSTSNMSPASAKQVIEAQKETLQNVVVNSPNAIPIAVEAAKLAAREVAVKYEAILNEKNPVKQAELVGGLAVMATVEIVDPLKKLEVVGHALEGVGDASKVAGAVGKVRHVEGELADDVISGKGLAVAIDEIQPRNALTNAKEVATGLKNKMLDAAEKIPVLGDVIAPSLSDRIIHQAHHERPRVMDAMDEKHRIGGDVEAMYAQHDDKIDRARALAEQVRQHPDAAAINRKVTNADISNLLNHSTNEQLGLPHNPSAVPKLPSPEQQAINNARQQSLEAGKQRLADEMAYQETLSPVGKLVRKAHVNTADPEYGYAGGPQMYGDTIMNKLKREATDKESDVIKDAVVKNLRGLVQVGTVVGAGVIAVTHDWRSDKEKNADLSQSFLKAVERGTDQGFKELIGSHKELKNAADQYKVVEAHLIKEGGGLSDIDREALKSVAVTYAKQIEEKGPSSFGEVSQPNVHSQVSQLK